MFDLKAKKHINHKNEKVADVTGTGDKYTDADNNKIAVEYCLRFKQYGGNWSLVTALVAPI